MTYGTSHSLLLLLSLLSPPLPFFLLAHSHLNKACIPAKPGGTRGNTGEKEQAREVTHQPPHNHLWPRTNYHFTSPNNWRDARSGIRLSPSPPLSLSPSTSFSLLSCCKFISFCRLKISNDGGGAQGMAFKRRRLLGHSAFAPCFPKVGVSGEVNLCLNSKRYERGRQWEGEG